LYMSKKMSLDVSQRFEAWEIAKKLSKNNFF
jgi:hypothetical protein